MRNFISLEARRGRGPMEVEQGRGLVEVEPCGGGGGGASLQRRGQAQGSGGARPTSRR